MIKLIVSTLLLLISSSIFSQIITGKILTENGILMSGVRVGIENDDIGDISNKDGVFEINISKIDPRKNLKVVESGYEIFQTKVEDFMKSNHEIILKEKQITIESLVINPKKYKIENFGTSNAKRAYFSIDSDSKNQVLQERAIKVENKRKLKIKNINLNITSSSFEGTAAFIFDIQNSKDGFPDDSQSLCKELLKLTVNEADIKNNKVTLDVSDQNIWTEQDFFVIVRMSEDFKGKLTLGGNIYAFSKSTYYRNYYGNWKKFSVGEPSINVDVLIEK